VTFSVFESSYHLLLPANHSKVNKRTCLHVLRAFPLILLAENQIGEAVNINFLFFGLTRRGNRIQVCRLRGGRFKHPANFFRVTVNNANNMRECAIVPMRSTQQILFIRVSVNYANNKANIRAYPPVHTGIIEPLKDRQFITHSIFHLLS